jgi:flagellin-like hook-associated protein FlgL
MIPINTNVPSLTSARLLGQNAAAQNRVMTQLSTGLRINAGKDDPAGLISSENLRAALRQLEAETRAFERASAIISTADAALGEVSELINDADALAVANANTGAMSDAERDANQMMMDSIVQSIDRIAGATTFNGQRLLDGSLDATVNGSTFSAGSTAARDLGVTESGGETFSLADLQRGGALDAQGDQSLAQTVIRAARDEVASLRGSLGAFARNVIEPGISQTRVAYENTASAESTIRDTDFAAASAELARASALFNAGVGSAALANQTPSRALQLLG